MRRKELKRSAGHGRFYGLLTLLLLLILTRYSLQIGIPRPVFLGIIFLIAVLGDRDEIIAMCMCCIPLHESIDFFYSVVICVSIYLLKYYKRIRINFTIAPVLFMVIWELLHCFEGELSIIGLLSGIVPLLVLAVFMSSDVSDVDYDFVTRAFAFAAAMVCLSLLVRVLYAADFNVASAFAGLQRLGMDTEESKQSMTVSGGEINPNTLGIICVLATTALMQLRTVGRGKKKDLVLSIILLVFGALTASRTYLACLALMLVLLLFAQKGSFAQKIRFLVGILLVLILALLVLGLVFPELMQHFYSRFLERDLTTGRLGLMSVYHDFIVSNPRVLGFGIGLQDFGIKMTEVYRVARNVPHNAIQELVIAWGLPGLVAFCALMILMIWRSRHFCRRQSLLHYIPILIILFKAQAGQMLNSAYTMLAFSYAYLSMTQRFVPVERQKAG